MIERQTPFMWIHKGKRGAGYFPCVNAQSAGQSFDEYGLTSAEWAAEEEDFTASELVADLGAEIECLVRAMGNPLAGG